jgi:uncharacterized membrane protein
MAERKSTILALILCLFFGPFGMLYSTIIGAAVMAVLYIVVGILTAGIGIAVLHPIAVIWGTWAAYRSNQ